MSKREDKADGEADDQVWETEAPQDDITGEGDGSNAEQSSEADHASSTVIDKGKAKLIISGAKEVEPDTPRVIAPEPRVVSVRPEKPVPAAAPEEEIERLEREVNPGRVRIKVDQAKFEELSERPDEAERQEEAWGKGISPGWWVSIAGVCVAVILLGGLAIKSWFDGDEVQEVTHVPAGGGSDDLHAGSPEKWFYERAGKIGTEANAVLSAFMSAPDDRARSEWVRQPEAYLNRTRQGEVMISPRLDEADDQSWMIDHTEDTAFLALDGRDADFMPFRAYFTREGEQLKLDWQATTARSEVSLQTMKKTLKEQQDRISRLTHDAREKQADSPPVLPAPLYTEPVMVRCMMRRIDEFYAGPYNDREHSAFMLLSADKAHYVWAYTARDSPLDLELRRLLDHGRFVVSLKKDMRVTVRIRRNQKDALPSQLELVEIVHPEWVTP